jgi:hypothetical protein
MILPRLVFFSVLIFCSIIASGQDTIYLRNPSFEDIPRIGTSHSPRIKGWDDCGASKFPTESPPDIHPTDYGAFGVKEQANDGHSYLGLVTRYDQTYESVSQLLSKEMLAGKCYTINVSLMLSPKYDSPTRRSPGPQTENFSNAVILRIWGGRYSCDEYDLLAQSKPVDNYNWQNYLLTFRPKQNVNSITFEAFFINNIEFYNGHLLLDNLSPIIEISCD